MNKRTVTPIFSEKFHENEIPVVTLAKWEQRCYDVMYASDRGRTINNQHFSRYVKLLVAHAPGMPETFLPATDFKGNR